MYNREDIRTVQQCLLRMAKEIAGVLEGNGIQYFIAYGTLLGAVRHQGFIPWDDDLDFYLFDDSYDRAVELLRKNLSVDLFVEDAKSEPLYFHGWAHVKDLHSEVVCNLFPQDGLYAHHGISVDLYRAKPIKAQEELLYHKTEHLKYLERKLKHHLIAEDAFNVKACELRKVIRSEEKRLQTVDLSADEDIYGLLGTYNENIRFSEVFPLRKYSFEDTEFYGPNDADAFLRRCYGNYMQLPPEEKRKPHYSDVRFR